jgi:DNA-3-methyladenine glycosylase II
MTDNPWYAAEQHLSGAAPELASLIASYGPCSLRPDDNHFSLLCDSIVSQQLANKAAAAIFGRFSAHYAGQPSPEKVLATSQETLRELGLSNQKTTYILDLAAKVTSGELTLNQFEGLADEEIITQLVKVKGIGVWTAQMFLIFALSRPDVLPVDDFGVRKAFMRIYSLPAMPVKAEMESIATPWRPWRTVASWYLWRSLDNS